MRGIRPSGEWASSYVADRRLLRSRWQLALLAVVAALLVFYPSYAQDTWLRWGTVTLITMVAVVGLQLLVGLTDQVSVGQSAFMGVGGYTAGALSTKLNWDLGLTLIAGGIAAALIGLAFGLPTLRIKGFYLALTTLAVQYVFVFAVPRLPESLFGGDRGLFLSTISVFGYDVADGKRFYYVVLTVAILAVGAALAIQESGLGRAFVAVRDNDIAAEMTGVPVRRLKLLAFAIASGYGGVAGVLTAYEGNYVSVTQFTLFLSVWFLGMLIVGGLGSVLGAVLGVVSLRWIEEIVRLHGDGIFKSVGIHVAGRTGSVVNVVIGVAICLMLILEPRGLASLYRQLERVVRLWPFPYSRTRQG